jgi:hypothetical protein
MRRPDHADALESLAALHCLSPLVVREWFEERAAIRQYEGGLDRTEAERLAVQDVAAELEGRK